MTGVTCTLQLWSKKNVRDDIKYTWTNLKIVRLVIARTHGWVKLPWTVPTSSSHRSSTVFANLSVKTSVLGAQKNRLIETVLLSTHNIRFGLEKRKSFFLITHSYLEACNELTVLVIDIGLLSYLNMAISTCIINFIKYFLDILLQTHELIVRYNRDLKTQSSATGYFRASISWWSKLYIQTNCWKVLFSCQFNLNRKSIIKK